MARGPSGRIVFELEPQVKRSLYGALEREGLTRKDWVTVKADETVKQSIQPMLLGGDGLPNPRTDDREV